MRPILPLIRDILTARDSLDTAIASARIIAKVKDDDASKYALVQLHNSFTSLNQAAAAILGGARYRRNLATSWAAGTVTAAAVAGTLSAVGLPVWLAAVVALPAAVAAGYFAPRWWVKHRFTIGARAIDVTKPNGQLSVELPEAVVAARRAVTRVNTALRDHTPVAASSIVFDVLTPRNARRAAGDAWLSLARAMHAIDNPAEAGYKYMKIPDDSDAPTGLGRAVTNAQARLVPVTDDIRNRGADVELALALVHLAAASDILGHTRKGLGDTSNIPRGKALLAYLPGLFAEPAVYTATTWLLLLIPYVPVAAAIGAAALATHATSWMVGRVRNHLTASTDPQFTATIDKFPPPITIEQFREIQQAWVDATTRHAKHLRDQADQLVADIDHLDEDAFDDALDALPKWHQYTYINLHLAAEHLDTAARHANTWNH